jgi:Sir2- and TIR-associating SLOG family/SIR2-like domain
MHGDIDHPADAVICKDEYEAYPLDMEPFVSALRGDLVEKTFLFLGFSFTDPNIDYILSRVRVQYKEHQRQHYCIQKKVSKNTDETDHDFKHRELMQHYFIRDLKRFGIQTVLVDQYDDITELLGTIAEKYKKSSIFISGAAEEYGPWSRADAESFLHKLSYQIAAKRNRVITGFGVGVGSAVINGALAYLNEAGKTISDEDLVMRPFPQVVTGTGTLAEQWTDYRKAMLDYAGIAIFVFGNKRDAAGNIVLSNGMREEFNLSIERGARALPIGATGYMAQELWKEMNADLAKYYPAVPASFSADFGLLGDTSKTPDELRAITQRLVEHLQKA